MTTPETPRAVAEREAARQAVALAFAIAGTIALIVIQKQLGGGTLFDVLSAEHDPAAAARRRMEAAQRAAKRWDRRASWLFVYGPERAFRYAFDRGEAARKAYEAERP